MQGIAARHVARAAALFLACSAPLALQRLPAAEPPDLYPEDVTPSMRASNDKQDLAVSADIRRALLADESLSLSARNIQISTNAQAVVLRGAVRAQEPAAIEAMARQYAGIRRIVNQLTVADR